MFFSIGSIKLKLNYLETCSNDQLKIIEYWCDTFEARRNILQIEKRSIQEYFKAFKALRDQFGRELVSLQTNLNLKKINSLKIKLKFYYF